MTIRGKLRSVGVANFELYRREHLASKIALWGVILLPFQQALTIDAGFPVKPSEVLFAISILAKLSELFFAEGRRDFKFSLGTPTFIIAGVLTTALALSASVALAFSDLSVPIPGAGRSPMTDLGLYTAYGLFALAIWVVIRSTNHRLLMNALMCSLWACGLAVTFQVAARIFRPLSPILSDLGFEMDRWGANIGGVILLRNGPFLEGQHLGFYAGGLLVLSLFAKRYASSVIAIACAVYSMSTTAFIAVAVALIITILARPSKHLLLAASAAAAAATACVAFVTPLRDAFLFQLSKLNLFGLGDPSRTKSLGVRSAKTEIGWQMMLGHPLGVGPGRFGLYFHDYVADYTVFSEYITSGRGRAIAENVYIQVGSELGALGLIALIALIGALILQAWLRDRAIFSLLVFVAIGIVTQSSWTFLPIWVFLGLGASVAFKPKRDLALSHGNVPSVSPRREYRRQTRPAQPR